VEFELTRDRLVSDLKNLGLEKGDVVLMHSNLRALAPVKQILAAPEGGMPYLVEAFREVLGEDGILAVPTFTKTFKPGQPGPTGQVWKPAETPSRVGQITNFVRQQPDARRSDHPTHPVSAIGKRAEEFCSGHSWRDGASTFDRNGPWGHLADWDGKIMWLGTGMPTQTACHVVEDWMRLPYMETCIALVDDGGETKEVEVTESPAYPRDFYGKDSKSAKAWDAAGLDTRGLVCKAESRVMSAPGFLDWLWKALLDDPALLLLDNDDDGFSAKARRDTAEHLSGFEGAWRR
jgi:aminoglycoside 3-N-acetyltransferase